MCVAKGTRLTAAVGEPLRETPLQLRERILLALALAAINGAGDTRVLNVVEAFRAQDIGAGDRTPSVKSLCAAACPFARLRDRMRPVVIINVDFDPIFTGWTPEPLVAAHVASRIHRQANDTDTD